ncbi:ParB/RepB/Spo0J family partition protein [Nostoc sp. FACHB-145]|uniref:ParB/RepB/Spo0J family partition protein n=1 Tax=Nostoc sp. FACHB-145 TaxID=2692836 RepID=UPI001686598A|nr:ParB/RepB/Spo0J family partition protein [Nostoc sp. FACHB-145]MBD2473099.1 ParB/RepB/Spo0J family partition protein [Nostoc sp. FACHB-145]
MSIKRNEPYTAIKKPVDLLFTSTTGTHLDEQTNSIHTVPLAKIKLPPSQPRRYFDPHKLEELSNSIKKFGILQPLVVRQLSNGDYELIAGERRYRSAIMAGLAEAPIISQEMDDETAYQVRLVENLQREDLNPVEETEGILELLSLRLEISIDETIKLLQRMENEAKGKITRNVTGSEQALLVEDIFAALGMKWDSFVRNRLPLLNLPSDVLDVLRSGKIEYTKAKVIAKLKNKDTRSLLLEEAVSQNLSLSEIKRKIQEIEQQSKADSTSSLKDRIDEALRHFKRSKVWDNPNKKTKLEKLLSQLETLIKEE